ncbi:MAG: serine/threonine protein kinase [Butyrivibrio sp.]|nr:serine/threonine protein kinase [Butyrivibrio sp.]
MRNLEVKVVKELGQGGNSRVFLGKRSEDGSLVTLKTARLIDGKPDIHSLKSFENEANILETLEHAAIPRFYGRIHNGIMLEYFEGSSLEKVLLSKGPFGEKAAAKIALELAAILRYLHGVRQPVIYRDLKPANIVFKGDGHVALIDFGAARFFRAGDRGDTTNLGTYGFAAPEQFGNLGQTDPRTDIYCFGMTLLQLISGIDPKDDEAVRRCKQLGVSGISHEFMQIIDKCTRPDREDRFKSAKEIQKALLTYPKLVRRRKALGMLKTTTVAAVIALILSLGMIHFDSVKSYAASDMEKRLPAVQQRLYNAKLWILEKIENELKESER